MELATGTDPAMAEATTSPPDTCTQRAAWGKGMAQGIVLCAAFALVPLSFLLDTFFLRLILPVYEKAQLEMPGITVSVLGMREILSFFALQILISILACFAVYLTGKILRGWLVPLVLAILGTALQAGLTFFFVIGIFMPFLSYGCC